MTSDPQLASLISTLSLSPDAIPQCPISIFSSVLRTQLKEKRAENISDALIRTSSDLIKEEEEINSSRIAALHTRDKLQAELTRIEAQMKDQNARLENIQQQKKLCKVALNMIVSGSVPASVAVETTASTEFTNGGRDAGVRSVPRDEDEGVLPSKSAPEPSPVKTSLKSRPRESESPKEPGPPASPRSTVSGNSLTAMLRLPEVSETALLSALENFERQTFSNDSWLTSDTYPDILDLMLSLLKHLPVPRPPVQIAELHILSNILQASPTANSTHNNNVYTIMETLIKKGNAISVLSGLLSSVNDDVKCEALEFLSPLVCGTQPLVSSVTHSDLFSTSRVDFLRSKGLEPLVNIVICSTSEAVLERALVFLWGLLSKDEKSDAVHNGGRSIRTQVRELGGLRAVLDLLYTDSLAILENVCMVIGYITREDVSKNEIREIGGLEKITATLRHPSDSIKTKMAGAVWNCASNAENRTYLRQLGAIPALLELLRQPGKDSDSVSYEFVRENAAGALWNLSVDAENKTMILEYGGVPVLIQVMSSSRSVAVVENVSGTLWNCSASVETRPLIRKCGGIPVLLALVDSKKTSQNSVTSDKILDNAAGTLRNCAINDQNKPAIQNAGGVELLLRRITECLTAKKSKVSSGTIDKLASTLWILTISPEIKQSIRSSGGIEIVLKLLKDSSPILAALGTSDTSPFPPLKSTQTASSAKEFEKLHYSAAALQKFPSSPPAISVSMSIREKLVGVLRNCSTLPENRSPLIKGGAVSILTAVILDCYSSHSVFQSTPSHKNGSRFAEPSVQLKETVASALWYLARDDKVTTREQGGLELMCVFLLTSNQPSVVLEQAAGALSSMSVSNGENRNSIRTHGGLLALISLVTEKAKTEYPKRESVSEQSSEPAHTYAVLNALLTIRNCTGNNEANVAMAAEMAISDRSGFGKILLYIAENGSEEAAREAVLTIKNLCTVPKALDFFLDHNAVKIITGLSDRATVGHHKESGSIGPSNAEKAINRVNN